MKKKTAPDQYTKKSVTQTQSKPEVRNPLVGVAKVLVQWMSRDEVPPSMVVATALAVARAPVNDGLPIDTLRPHIKPMPEDSKLVGQVLEALSKPGVDKVVILKDFIESHWVKKEKVATPKPQKVVKTPQKQLTVKKVAKPRAEVTVTVKKSRTILK